MAIITYEEARTLVAATGLILVDERNRESDDWWFFGVQEIGFQGVVVDKRDGSLCQIGSAYPLDDFLWGYDQGLRDTAVEFMVTEILDRARAIEWLYKSRFELSRVYVREKLAALPTSWMIDWRAIPDLRALEPGVLRWHIAPPSASASPGHMGSPFAGGVRIGSK